jgi:hypothetical protein
VDGTGSGPCPMEAFGISDVYRSSYTELISKVKVKLSLCFN